MLCSVRRLCFCIIIIIAFNPESPGAVDADEFFNFSQKKMVKKGRILTRVRVKGTGGFNLSGKDTFPLPRSKRIPPTFSDYEVLAEERAFIPYNLNRGGRLRFYNSLFAFSRFAGTKYYSSTDRSLLTYLPESSVVDSVTFRKKYPDPVFGAITAKRTIYYRVRDNRFGEIVLRGDIFAGNNLYSIESRNVHSLKKLGITVVAKDMFRTMAVFLYDEQASGFYYYSLHAIRFNNGFFASSGFLKADSLANRVRAETVRRAFILGHNWNGKIKSY